LGWEDGGAVENSLMGGGSDGVDEFWLEGGFFGFLKIIYGWINFVEFFFNI
jgi:hypothetical protein